MKLYYHSNYLQLPVKSKLSSCHVLAVVTPIDSFSAAPAPSNFNKVFQQLVTKLLL
jgi:hypothetical protein